MSRTRILFLPCFFGMPSHFIPLVKLYQRLPKDAYDVAFFLPDMPPEQIGAHNPQAAYYYSPEFFAHFDIPKLDFKQRFGVVNELNAYTRFAPDVIIDDTSLTTALARQINWRPRLTIARTGVFGARTHRPFPSGLWAMVDLYRVPPAFRSELPQSIEGYFEAEAHLIPGIRSLESLQGLPDDDGRAFYCGPLILDEREERLLYSDALEQFLEKNRGRRLAYVTFGIDASKNPHAKVHDCMRELMQRDFAVITNMRMPEGSSDERYFHAAAVPMHHVCSRASLIVHVAGSATYQYPILHGKPAITIGTQMREREEVAQTLAARGLSHHIPAPAETDAFHELWIDALARFESSRFPFDAGLPARLNAHRLEMHQAAAEFDIEAAIGVALAQAEARRAAQS